MTEMDIAGILQYLPHRYPFVMLDRVRELELGKRIVAIKNVSINEPYFPGHFPYKPIMPGVLILEAMAQAACILAFRTMGAPPTQESIYYYAAIDKARFKRPVVPGDVLEIHVAVLGAKRGFWKFTCQGIVDGNIATEAEIVCTMRPNADGPK